MRKFLFCLEDDYPLFGRLAQASGLQRGELITRRFPCGESYLRVLSPVRNRECVVLAPLHQPDARIPGLLFLARVLRDLGAAGIQLVAPYLPYMRQDRRFRQGEGLTSVYFADLISQHFDSLVTVDPHLHRYHDLGQIYRIPSRVVGAAPAIASWIAANVPDPVLVGPDAESRQWVSRVADHMRLGYTIMEKTRHGDTDVSIALSAPGPIGSGSPVLIDDIASSGATLAAAIARLRDASDKPPVCVVTHAILAESAIDRVRKAGGNRIVSANTIPHACNAIDVSPLLAGALEADIVAAGERHKLEQH